MGDVIPALAFCSCIASVLRMHGHDVLLYTVLRQSRSLLKKHVFVSEASYLLRFGRKLSSKTF